MDFERHMSTAVTAVTLMSQIQLDFERIKDATKATDTGTPPNCKSFPIPVHQPKRLSLKKKKKSTEHYVGILYQITFRTPTSSLPWGIWSFTVAILTEGKEINWLCS